MPGEAADGRHALPRRPARRVGGPSGALEGRPRESGGHRLPDRCLILITAFGSLAAAALPLALGFVAVIVTGAVIYLLSLSMEMSVFVTNMASMIGIGVAVDYSLFVLARYREEVRAGRSADEAREAALSTSGLAVAFSGMAVIISLAGIWMVDNQALRSMALGAMIVVAIAIIAAIVLLPTLISLLGHRVEAGGIAWRVTRFFKRHTDRVAGAARARPHPDGESAFWQRWTDRVMRRPVVSVVLSAGTLLFLAIPVLSMETGTGALSQFPDDHDVTVGVELLGRVERRWRGSDPRARRARRRAPNPARRRAPCLALRSDIGGDRAVVARRRLAAV